MQKSKIEWRNAGTSKEKTALYHHKSIGIRGVFYYNKQNFME